VPDVIADSTLAAAMVPPDVSLEENFMIATVLDAYPTPPCAVHLGLDIIEANPEAGTVRIRFQARPEFLNASGTVQGGFLAAMLDDTIGPAVLITTHAKRLPVTIGLTINYLAPAKAGPIIGHGVVRKLGKSIGYVEASLKTEDGEEIAHAVSNVRLVDMQPP